MQCTKPRLALGDTVKLGGPQCDPRLSNQLGLITGVLPYGYEVQVTDTSPTTWVVAAQLIKEKINA